MRKEEERGEGRDNQNMILIIVYEERMQNPFFDNERRETAARDRGKAVTINEYHAFPRSSECILNNRGDKHETVH